jgi:putative transport protein
MDWFRALVADPASDAGAILIFMAVASLGLALGSVRIRGINFGVAGVLFVGLLFGHLGFRVQPAALNFLREFGLILFVYSVGLSIGPGFFSALRAYGLRLNLLAAAVVGLGVVTTLLIAWLGNINLPVAVGLMTGATTNTPSLAAANEALRDQVSDDPAQLDRARAAVAQVAPDLAEKLPPADLQRELFKLPGLGYAVAYPFGIIGVILVLSLLQAIVRVDPKQDAAAIAEQQRLQTPPLERATLRLTNPNLIGRRIDEIPALALLHIVVSRVQRGGAVLLGRPDFVLAEGDILLVVVPADHLAELRLIVGEPAGIDLLDVPSDITHRWMVVTRPQVVGRSLADLALGPRHGVQVAGVRRGEVELPPDGSWRLALGDQVHVVGPLAALEAVALELGDEPRQLEVTDLVPIFIGIALGVLLGSIPFPVPGLPTPLRLGLAAGPLLVALAVTRFERIGPLIPYVPRAASNLLRDLGIVLFLACVGLRSGDRFVETLTQGDGLKWLGLAALITAVPLLVVGLFGCLVLRMRYTAVAGVLVGSMTSPPGLAYANAAAGSEVPAIAYATVYPMTMILRVLAAQVLLLAWTG